jgi:hypothetical protein
MLILLVNGWSDDARREGDGLGPLARRIMQAVPTAHVRVANCSANVAAIVRDAVDSGHSDIRIGGYSYGGSKAIYAAFELAKLNITIERFAVLDPVPRWLRGQFQNFPIFGSGSFGIPTNIPEALCLYNARGWLHGLPLRENGRTLLVNWPVDFLAANHTELPGIERLQQAMCEFLTGAPR